MNSTAFLLLLLFQDPQGVTEPRTEVVVEMKTGGTLVGTVVEETADYVQLRTGPRTIVGFEKARIASIVPTRVQVRGPLEEAALSPSDEWFVLHDAEGKVVGRMHATVLEDEDGRLRVGEEWEFRGPRQTTSVTLLEVVNRDLTPVSSFFHERMSRNVDGLVVVERLVRGTVDGDRFTVERKGLESQRSTYELDEKLRFPLSLVQSLRQRAKGALDESYVVFDARNQAFSRRTFASSRRTVQWQSEIVHVSEVQHGEGRRQNTEWLDASCRTLRREINGPSLVAVPVAAEMTERYLMSTEAVFPSAVAVELDSRFALWLPSPAWQMDPAERPGRITVRDPLHDASASLVAFDQLESDVLIDTAADTVSRWLRQASGLELRSREKVMVRDREAIRLSGHHVEGRPGAARELRSEVYVLAAGGGYVALCFTSPKVEFEMLRGDFKRILASVDLYPAEPPGK